MITIRAAAPGDMDSLYSISALTGDAGKDASPLHVFPELIGHIYSAPYLLFCPELAFVAEKSGEVLGYCVGTTDTDRFAAQLEADWWPKLREKYPRPAPDKRALWTADDHMIEQIHAPEITPRQVVEPFPAHLHMNLLGKLRGHGVGSLLMQRWARDAIDLGVRGAHIGAQARNAAGIGFWGKQGFKRVAVDAALEDRDTVWMGQPIGSTDKKT